MTESEMNSYRFSSGEEPTDEMLCQLMKEVAKEAVEKKEQASAAYFNEMRKNAAIKKEKWAERINSAINKIPPKNTIFA